MTTFVVLEPEQWGMRWARPPVAERLGDPEVYVHHRAGNPYHSSDAADVFFDMNEAAISAKGYSATDYDVLVHENTVTDTVTIGIARGPWLSAATRDRNEQGEAVCALGYFHPGSKLSERPSPGMIEGVARAIALTIERGWAAPDASILGHRDNPAHVGATSCPGDYLYAEMGTIRARVAELIAPPVVDIPEAEPQPQPEPEDRPMRYMLKPPTERKGGPWFLRWDGTWSYLTGRDRDLLTAEGVETYVDEVDRYDLVRKQVFG